MITTSSRRRVAGVAAASVVAALTISNLGGTPAANAADPTCGSTPSPSATYTECAFYDDFTGTLFSSTTLDGSKWRKINSTATNKAFTLGNCIRTGQVTVGMGQLHLTSKVLDTPMKCWGFGSSAVYTRLVGGAVTTDTKFTTTYGRIEFRARLAAYDRLSWTALWMSPDKNVYNVGGMMWPYNGEIDVIERPVERPWNVSQTTVSLHYADKSGAIDRETGDKNPGETLTTCTVANLQDWHTYSAEWTPTQLRFYIDDVQCGSLGWDPASPLTPPAPFDKPFNLIANQLAVADATTPAAGSNRVTDVDWVKVWKIPD